MKSRHNIDGLGHLLEILEQGHIALVEASRETMAMSYLNPNEITLYKAHNDLSAIVKSIAHTKSMLKRLSSSTSVKSSPVSLDRDFSRKAGKAKPNLEPPLSI